MLESRMTHLSEFHFSALEVTEYVSSKEKLTIQTLVSHEPPENSALLTSFS